MNLKWNYLLKLAFSFDKLDELAIYLIW